MLQIQTKLQTKQMCVLCRWHRQKVPQKMRSQTCGGSQEIEKETTIKRRAFLQFCETGLECCADTLEYLWTAVSTC